MHKHFLIALQGPFIIEHVYVEGGIEADSHFQITLGFIEGNCTLHVHKVFLSLIFFLCCTALTSFYMYTSTECDFINETP